MSRQHAILEDTGINNKKPNLGKFIVNLKRCYKMLLVRDEVVNHCNNIASVMMNSSLDIFN